MNEHDDAESPQERNGEHEAEEEQDEFNCDHDWLYLASEYPKHALLDLCDAMMSR